MKTLLHHRPGQAALRRRGFTIPEYSITITVVALVSMAMLGALVFSARLFALARTEIDMCTDARELLGDFVADVRMSWDLDIGQGSETSFKAVGEDELRKGNSLQIYTGAGTNSYVRYYVDTNAQSLRLVMSGTAGSVLLANAVTNKMPFTCEDPWGNVVTNDEPWTIVGMQLQFCSTAIRLTTNAATSHNKYLQLSTRVMKRTVLGYQD